MKKKVIALVLVMCMVFALCACAGGGDKTQTDGGKPADSGAPAQAQDGGAAKPDGGAADGTQKTKDNLVVGMAAEITSFDTTTNTGSSIAGIVIDLVMDTLFFYDDTTGQILPRLATEWEYEDELHFNITLRDDVFFANGEKMTADDVIYTINRLSKAPMMAANFMSFDLPNCTAVDDTHVQFVLKEPFAPMLKLFSNFTTAIVCSSYVEEQGDNYGTNPMGSGPFAVSSWVSGEGITLTLRDDYWGEKPAFSTVEFRFLGENSTRFMELQTGGVDLIDTPSTSDIDSVLSGSVSGIEIVMNHGYDHVCWCFNQDDPVFQDKNVREAMAHAINYERLVELVYGSAGTVPTSTLGEEMFGYKNVGCYSYDPDLSRRLLADAGYADGLSVSCTVPSDGMYAQLAEICQAMFGEVGITLDIHVVDHGTAFAAYMNGEATMGFMELKATMSDPSKIYDPLRMHGAMRLAATHDEQLEQWMAEGLTTTDEAARRALYENIQQSIFDNVYMIPVADYAATFAVADYVEGFVGTATMLPNLRNITFTK